MSFTAKVLGSKSNLLWLVKGDHKSLKAWWFVLVKPLKLSAFKAALGSGSMLLTEYGEIISSGYGENPSANDIEEIKQKGFELDESVFA